MKTDQWQRLGRLLGMLSLALLLAAPVTEIGKAEGLSPLPPVTEADGRLGICFAHYEAFTGLAYDAGARWDRFDFHWWDIEDQNGYFDYGPHEQAVARVLGEGRDVLGILGSTPWWYADCPPASTGTGADSAPLWDDPKNGCPPENLDLAWNHPDNHWGQFVWKVVDHFKGDVDTWEIWNNPDMAWYWKGTPEQFARLLKVAYLAAKDANPDATILFGGLNYWENPAFYTQVLETLAADPEGAAHTYFFDVMALHTFSDVRHAHDLAAEVKQTVADRVGEHPLWITEAGVAIWTEDYGSRVPSFATPDEAAAFVIQAYAGTRAAGAERVFLYRLHDDYNVNVNPYRYGLVKDNGELRPAYLAAQVAARYLRDENQITGPFGDDVRRVTFWGTPHGRVDVLWNTTSTALTHTHPAYLPTATLVTHQGVTSTLTASGDAFTLTLDAATANYGDGDTFIGGPPVLLIQQDDAPPTSTLEVLPATAPSNPLTVTWMVTDTGAGYWYEEIAYSDAPTGSWTTAAGWPETQGVTQTQITLPGSGTWYLRARARDHVGNWEAWPATAEVSTTLNLRTVVLTATAFSDVDGDGVQSGAEITLDNVTMRWLDAEGDLVAEAITRTWNVSRTVDLGTQHLTFEHADHLPGRATFDVPDGATPLIITHTQPLHPIVARLYLPLVLRP
ncbi:MAG: hypothetical protein ACP5HM_15195 [Anaerolineae bacterium]